MKIYLLDEGGLYASHESSKGIKLGVCQQGEF